MKTNMDKNFEIPLMIFLISSILCTVLFAISAVGYYWFVDILYSFCFAVTAIVSLLICFVYAIKKMMIYEKHKKAIFAVFGLAGMVLMILTILISELKMSAVNMVNQIILSQITTYPLHVTVIFALIFVIGGIVAGTVCRRFKDTFYWLVMLLTVNFVVMLGTVAGIYFGIIKNFYNPILVIRLIMPICTILFCWTAWMTIKTKRAEKIKLFVSIKAVVYIALIVLVFFLPITYELTEIGGKYKYDTSSRDEVGSDIEQMQIFLKQNTSGQSNAEKLGWDIENSETWDGVVFDGDDIVSIDLQGRGIGGKMEIIYFDKLVALDVSDNPALYELDCSYNQLKMLDVSGNTGLRTLNCGGNRIETIDVSDNINLERFSCRGNLLTSLDVSKNTRLNELYCYDNKISEIDLSKNNNLVTLYCGGNPISSLDVSGHEKLATLNCDDSERLATIDVTGCYGLVYLHSWNTKVQVRDIKGITSSTKLLMDYSVGYVVYRRSPEKQIKLIAIILAVHVLTDIGMMLAGKISRRKNIE